MSKPSPGQLAFAATGFLCIATPILLALCNVRIEPSFLFKVAGAVVFLQLVSIRYRKQDEKPLVGAINGAALLMVFTTVYAVAHYCLPHMAGVFYDDTFAAIDEAMGMSARDITLWARESWVDDALAKIYYAFFFQFALYIPYASGVRRDWYRMYECLSNMFISALIGLVIFAIWPAKNTVWFYKLDDIHGMVGIAEQLQLLQDGTFGLLTHQNALGLMQFPSFHVAIAVILWWDMRYEHKAVLAIGGVWTAVMSVSAVTAGAHYVIDIWGGIAVAAISILATKLLTRPRNEDELDPVPLWRRDS